MLVCLLMNNSNWSAATSAHSTFDILHRKWIKNVKRQNGRPFFGSLVSVEDIF